jgi:hypothetical protein
MHHEVGGGHDHRDPVVLLDPQIAGASIFCMAV